MFPKDNAAGGEYSRIEFKRNQLFHLYTLTIITHTKVSTSTIFIGANSSNSLIAKVSEGLTPRQDLRVEFRTAGEYQSKNRAMAPLA